MYPGFFRAASKITDMFPRTGSKLLDMTLSPVVGSNILATHKLHGARQKVEEVGRFARLLVVSDLNIGDALLTQALVSGLGDFFPTALIDIAINKAAADIITGNPEITNVLPVFSRSPFPATEDLMHLSRITSSGNYDLIICLCPYFDLKDFPSSAKNVLDYSPFAAVLINAFTQGMDTGHIIYQLHRFVHLLFGDLADERRSLKFVGVRATLPVHAIERARGYLRKNGVSESDKLILINTDTSSRFTKIPNGVLRVLLKRISKLGCPILMGSGYIDLGTEKRLLETMSVEDTKNLTVVTPMIGLEVYSALIDLSRVFITGDSGPLHIAAARRYLQDGDSELKNRTELISIFGATPARTYGYDSVARGFFPANQDAPSRA
jgi:ADP-heptose:LPS heptosyltransferase